MSATSYVDLRSHLGHEIKCVVYGDEEAVAPLMEFVQDHRKLLTIADELEGITYGTYRCDLETQ